MYMHVYLLFGSGLSFSWTGARNGNLRKFGTEEEERRRARRPPRGLGRRDGARAKGRRERIENYENEKECKMRKIKR